MKQPTRGRFAPPSQVPPLAFLFSSSFEFTFNLNYDKKMGSPNPLRKKSKKVSASKSEILDVAEAKTITTPTCKMNLMKTTNLSYSGSRIFFFRHRCCCWSCCWSCCYCCCLCFYHCFYGGRNNGSSRSSSSSSNSSSSSSSSI